MLMLVVDVTTQAKTTTTNNERTNEGSSSSNNNQAKSNSNDSARLTHFFLLLHFLLLFPQFALSSLFFSLSLMFARLFVYLNHLLSLCVCVCISLEHKRQRRLPLSSVKSLLLLLLLLSRLAPQSLLSHTHTTLRVVISLSVCVFFSRFLVESIKQLKCSSSSNKKLVVCLLINVFYPTHSLTRLCSLQSKVLIGERKIAKHKQLVQFSACSVCARFKSCLCVLLVIG